MRVLPADERSSSAPSPAVPARPSDAAAPTATPWAALPPWLWRLPVAGFFVVTLFACTERPFTSPFMPVLAVGSLIGAAALMAGGLLGFLFGIPRALQGDPPGGGEGSSEAGQPTRYGGNTNLEQISDWLTKILVGAGLVQLGSLSSSLRKLANDLGASLGSSPAAADFAMVALVYFAACGFIIGYLWTRLNLPKALAQAESGGILTLQREVKALRADVQLQTEQDARALSLLARQLDVGQDEVDRDELEDSVAAASTPVKVTIFAQARQQRAANWKVKANKPKMERTAAIFRALIASDHENQFHRHFAQLAYALKDSLDPDYAEAERLLTEAIRIRADRGGFRTYELARAECRIQQRPSRADAAKRNAAIRADLAEVASIPSLTKNLTEPGSAFHEWMVEQGVTIEDLQREP